MSRKNGQSSLLSLSELDPLVLFVFDFLPVPGLGWSFDVLAVFVFGDDAFEAEGECSREHRQSILFNMVNIP